MGVGNPENEDADQLDHPRQLPPDRARHPGGRRDGDQERPGHEDPGQLRRGRLVHRVLRDGLHRRRRAHGPRRSRPHRHRRGQDQGAAARGLSRQGRARALGRDVREARAGHAALGGADGGRPAQAPGGRGRVGAGPDPRDRQHEQPLPLPHRRPALRRTSGTATARPTTAPWAWATSPRGSRSSAACSTWRSPGSASPGGPTSCAHSFAKRSRLQAKASRGTMPGPVRTPRAERLEGEEEVE